MKEKNINYMERKMSRQYLALVLPGFVIFTIGLIIPLFMAVRYSFTSWDGMSLEKPFVGIQNYIDLFKDSDFRNAWWFTIKFTIGNTIIQNVVALLFAIALDSGIKAQKIYRTILFVPCLISALVVGFVWLKMFSNVLLELNEMLGTNIDFLLFGKKETVLTGLLIANNWQWIGYWMLIYLAGLQSVPYDLYEAAKVDGAGPVKCHGSYAGSGDYHLCCGNHHGVAEGIRSSGIIYKGRTGKGFHIYDLSDLYDGD